MRLKRILLVGSSILFLMLGSSLVTQAAAAPALPAQPASYSSCLSLDLCLYSGENGTGTKKAYYKCQTIGSPFNTAGSLYNHQTANAYIYLRSDGRVTIKPGEKLNSVDWSIVSSIRTC